LRLEVLVELGDIVEVEAEKVGSKARTGTVISVEGKLIRVRWSTGQESTFVPAAGSLRVVGHEAGGGPG
jgi:hypothetical protein